MDCRLNFPELTLAHHQASFLNEISADIQEFLLKMQLKYRLQNVGHCVWDPICYIIFFLDQLGGNLADENFKKHYCEYKHLNLN